MALVVLLIAADCAFWRLCMDLRGGFTTEFAMFGIFPMLNILAVCAFRLLTRPSSRGPFLVGFVVSGAAASLAWVNLFLTVDERRVDALGRGLNSLLFGPLDPIPLNYP
jgi:hypothetical protein